jgi:hypothetical protein
VRELVERGPYIVASGALGDACALCGKVEGRAEPLVDPAVHEPSCLWRRAVERYPSENEQFMRRYSI